ncbi:MAG: PEGA domain-containing protein [Polyangiales bacterium]
MIRRALFLACVLAAGSASAQSPEKLEQAKALFNAGAQAYSIGQFTAAIQAFEEAYKISPRPAILFSLAQAERKQYFVDHQPQRLERAVESYRRYVSEVQQGGRRADAVQALSELEPILEKQKAQGAPPPAAAPEVKKVEARVMVTSPTSGAQVSLDGGTASEAPFIGEVKPGKHHVLVTAKGHDAEKRDIQVVEGGLVALDLPLKERPALLAVSAPSGAEIHVDGRLVGVAPLMTPISLGHGRHFVAVMKNGAVAWARDVDLVRGETRTVDPQLATSTQRKISYVVLGASAAALVTGGVFIGLTLDRQSKAQSILDERAATGLTPSRLDEYDQTRDQRDRYKLIATVTLAGGAVLGVSGLLLYTMDRPSVPMREAGPSDKTGPAPVAPTFEVRAVPVMAPTFAGASLHIAF